MVQPAPTSVLRKEAYYHPEYIAREDQAEIVYPESDGEPMAESDYQREPLIYVVKALDIHFAAHPNVYVSGNLLIYYVKGDTHTSLAPDAFVVFGVPKRLRSTYKVWEENKAPDIVFEITSPSTYRKDEEEKPAIYRNMGVREYFQYDPTGEFMTPALRGRRLDANGDYQFIPGVQHQDGLVLSSQVLNLELHLEGLRLRLYDPVKNEHLLSHEESERGRRQAEKIIARREEELHMEIAARKQAEEHYRQSEVARKQAEKELQAEREFRQRLEEELRAEREFRQQLEAQLKTKR